MTLGAIDDVIAKLNDYPNPAIRNMIPNALNREINIPERMKLGYLHLYTLPEDGY